MKNPCCRKLRFFLPLFVLAVVALVTLVVYGLWNGVLVGVLGVKIVTYWQALGILVLAKILFGGFPGRRGGPCGSLWRSRMTEAHWDSLTNEQRDEMREEMRRRFGDWPRPPCCGGDAEKPGDKTKS